MVRLMLAAMTVLATLVPVGPAFCDGASPGPEEMELFQAADRLADRFRAGKLPLRADEGGDRLYDNGREAPERMTEAARRRLFDRAMGQADGGNGIAPNGDFNALWLRSVRSASEYERQSGVDRHLGDAAPPPLSRRQVRRAARNLAAERDGPSMNSDWTSQKPWTWSHSMR